MLKLAMVASAAAALLLCTATVSDQAYAAGAKKAPRAAVCPKPPHKWGDRDWEIIRWSYGDCKIWRDDSGPPTGTCGKDWVVLAEGLRTWDAGWARLQRLRAKKLCT
jgi:hypothetical protein